MCKLLESIPTVFRVCTEVAYGQIFITSGDAMKKSIFKNVISN